MGEERQAAAEKWEAYQIKLFPLKNEIVPFAVGGSNPMAGFGELVLELVNLVGAQVTLIYYQPINSIHIMITRDQPTCAYA